MADSYQHFEQHPSLINDRKCQLLDRVVAMLGVGTPLEPVDLVPLQAKIDQLVLENNFLVSALTQTGCCCVKGGD